MALRSSGGGAGAGRRFRLRAHAAPGGGGGERRAALFPRRVRAHPPPLVLVRRDRGLEPPAAAPVLSCAVAAVPAFDRSAAAELSRPWRRRSTCSSACATGWWSSAAHGSRTRTTRLRCACASTLTLLPKPFQLSALTGRDLQLESPWKRVHRRAPRRESREPGWRWLRAHRRRGGCGRACSCSRRRAATPRSSRATIRCSSA